MYSYLISYYVSSHKILFYTKLSMQLSQLMFRLLISLRLSLIRVGGMSCNVKLILHNEIILGALPI